MTSAAPPAAHDTTAHDRPPYASLSRGDRYLHETRDRALLRLLRRHGIETLAGRRVIEIGCGEGALLRTLRDLGATPALLHGIDVDGVRARIAARLGAVAVADAGALPYRDGAFDLALLFTSLSSMPEAQTRRRAAAESMRVLRRGGLAVVYDFWVNPFNRRVRPVGADELQALFAPRPVEIERVTLAPPLARALGGRPAVCRPLERVPLLRTHLLAAIVKDA